MKKQNKRGNENGIKRYKSSKDEIQKNENGRNGRTKRNRLCKTRKKEKHHMRT